jgi:putative ABC transport system permease protein
MIRNYIRIAVRNMNRYKAFSSLNILGLTMGLVCSILIWFWVRDENSYDSHQPENLYIIYEKQFIDNKVSGGYYTPGVLANEMKRVIPEIQYASNVTAVGNPDKLTFALKDKAIKFKATYADADYFKMMNFPLLKGTKETALSNPVSLCVSEKVAKAFFGSADAAIGKTIRYENKKDLIISAVFADLPVNGSNQFDCVVNWFCYLEENQWAKQWGNNGPNTLVSLKAPSSAQAVDKKIRKFLDNYNKEQTASFRIELHMQPFREFYLNSNFKDGIITSGKAQYVHLFSIVAVFILLIACINFMNLTTARSSKRAKEIGVRKVVGAVKGTLMRQFFIEAILTTVIAVVLALIIVIILLPSFNHLTQKEISFPFGDTYFWVSTAALTFITGFIAGAYPAIFLASFKPIVVLKGKSKQNGSVFLRKGLVVFQFTLSILLISGTIIVSRQINFIQQMNLGYDRENLIYIPVEGTLAKTYNIFKIDALKEQSVKSVTRIGETPTGIGSATGGVSWDGKDPNSSVNFVNSFVGYDFIKTMNLKLLAGRDISKEFAGDTVGYLINESALKVIGYKDPIGKPLTFWEQKGTIVGVLKDFHFASLHNTIEPLILRNGENASWGSILVRVEAGKTKEAVEGLEKIVKNLNPDFPFTYYFADEEYQKLYLNEQVVSKLSVCFAFLAIFISCLGLLGLAMFTAEQRVKEIGIRKVLGANIASLFTLLSKDFIALVFIAMLIAMPIAWLLIQNWLNDFAYRAPVGIWIFGIAGLLTVMIALITISFQSLKAALANPVKSLRTE